MASDPKPSPGSSGTTPPRTSGSSGTGATPPLSAEAVEHQDQSIKVRKSQLFEAPTPADGTATVRPFAEYVRLTPAAPLPKATRVAIWVVASLVVLLFLAALLFGHNPRTPRRRRAGAGPAQSVGKAAPETALAWSRTGRSGPAASFR